MIKFSEVSRKYVSGTFATTTAGTRVSVAHGLNYTPALIALTVRPTAGATDTDDAQAFAIVSADGTNIVLKPTRTLAVPSTVSIEIGLEEQGPANAGRP
jgi:hypothetical protein